jgi:hypothetical protein
LAPVGVTRLRKIRCQSNFFPDDHIAARRCGRQERNWTGTVFSAGDRRQGVNVTLSAFELLMPNPPDAVSA